MRLIQSLNHLHSSLFDGLSRLLDGWFLGLTARFIFSSVLMFYFFNSALTKIGDGIFGIFNPSVGAYAQILPPIIEAVGYDASQIAFFPWTLIVILGTAAEFILPVLIFLGLGTRLASVAFIGFILVMTFVDINFHAVDASTIGRMFDRIHNSEILDQRLLWLFPLLFLIVKGPGKLSFDHLLRRWVKSQTEQQV
ncbi:DoxX family protein [Cohaesibacter celericrescens]|uniref:DoxX family protein n=1 Tax=Cohaesibacter celericrescens TaxID=2067669 RepID=A0A2N5XX46_9HYPH|nr:DoxX family protein [Cohaesibacter celericrescens]PLW79015.1 hypothetical protein C0081_01930 [Cohaesibacter celericrescens]